MSHKHITPEQRNVIAVLKRIGTFQKDIAIIIGVTPSAISQELTRNKDEDSKYRAGSAKKKKKEDLKLIKDLIKLKIMNG